MDKHDKLGQEPYINRASRVRNLATGLALTGLALGGGVLVADGSVSLTHDFAITTSHAEPSNALAEGFGLLEDVGAAIGTIAILKRGVRHFRSAIDPKEAALEEVAHASMKHKTIASRKVPRIIAASGVLTTFTGIVAGSFFNISDNVSKTQSNVAEMLQTIVPPHDTAFILSDTPTPSVLNMSSVNQNTIAQIDNDAKKTGTSVTPVDINWAGGSYSTSSSAYNTSDKSNTPNYNLEFLTIGLPQSETGIQRADKECNNVEVNVSSELGLRPGEFFDLQGLKVKVHQLINGYSGFNLLPVVFNNSDYQRCLLTENKEGASSFTLVDSTPSKMSTFLKLISKTYNNNPQDRLYAVSFQDFINNAETAGKNAVNGLVLEAMFIGMTLGAIALNYKTSQDLANNRSRNRMLKANGFDEHLIMKLYRERSELDAIVSALLAMPGIEIVDTLVNNAQPGGALGINLETYVSVTGLLWIISRISTSLAVRRESRMIENQEIES
ncbi:hypothetical protein M1512_01120 [Patescibacteria group bacterium]|nr:hypothetical protein [Patescibacteria group bacterium]